MLHNNLIEVKSLSTRCGEDIVYIETRTTLPRAPAMSGHRGEPISVVCRQQIHQPHYHWKRVGMSRCGLLLVKRMWRHLSVHFFALFRTFRSCFSFTAFSLGTPLVRLFLSGHPL
ncbi:hypothetical protein EVAR_102624_1 [Eumeta japonica]|uniref:Uncharacterized protein n=1 Tax=Eumeta variegata TaxID=151549 RepID=A0A4C1TUS1_EUMVA|nr:hypothetical protein EVAR_102624_1 [Eumeta japonica]